MIEHATTDDLTREARDVAKSYGNQGGHLMTVQDAAYNLLRKLGLTTIFGNPGSTEQPFLKNFPNDFQFVLGLSGGLGCGDGRRFRPSDQEARAFEFAFWCRNRQRMCNIMTAFQNVALAEKKMKTGRPVVAVIGDGAFQYSVQDVYAAVQQKLKVVFVVPCNGEYAILKEFAVPTATLPTDLIYAVRISHAPDSRWAFDVGNGHVGANLGPGINIKVNNAIAFAANFRFSRRSNGD